MSRVMEMLECPSTSETIFGCTPLVSKSVAQVCLGSWKRTPRTPARRRSGFRVGSDTRQGAVWSLGQRLVRVAPPPVLAGLEGGDYRATQLGMRRVL